MGEQFQRTRMLMGNEALKTLARSRVAVFGLGGVGGYVVEILARSGVGELHLVDNDRITLTNLNRQILALHSTLGRLKVDVAAERIHDIWPQCCVVKYPLFYLPETADVIDLTGMDYVVDCIDTVTAKLHLIRRCHELGVPLLSCMGAANKMSATAFRVADICQTKMDPLARVIRRKLRDWGISHLKVVYSEEPPQPSHVIENFLADLPTGEQNNKQVFAARRVVPASNAFVPAAEGVVAGGEVVRDLISITNSSEKH